MGIAPKTVLITGATGVVGSAIVPYFLQEPDTKVILIIRATSAEHLRQRVDTLAAFWAPEISQAQIQARVEALAGDVTLPCLGLEPALYDNLTSRVTHIVHCAGKVKMNMSEQEAEQVSVASTRHVLDLQARCHARQGCKLDYVSTLGVAGKMRGLIEEIPLHAQPGFHNTYESSKAKAERLVLDQIAALPITVHRPSMVVGDSHTGKIINFQVFYYLSDFIAGKHTFGFIPATKGTLLDLIPVDYVARAIHWSSQAEAARGKILHLCSGPEQAIDILALAQELQRLASRQGEHLPRLRVAPIGLFRGLITLFKGLAPAQVRKGLTNLPLFLDYIEDAQHFDNRHTQILLAEAKLSVPSPMSYLPMVLAYRSEKSSPKAH